jgi:sugar/nucleoside kinase (ribokinase family)
MTQTSRFNDNPLLIVGSMAFDDLELPSRAVRNVVGGSATYAALAASLYTATRIVAVVGDDFPEGVIASLEGRGVDVGGIDKTTGKTFRWSGRYSENLASRVTLDTQLNVFAGFNPVLPEHYRDSPFVLLGNIHPGLQLQVLEQTKSPRLVAADTMNFWIEGEKTELKKVLSRIDTLVINDEELRQLGEDHNMKRAARAVLHMGPKRLVVKRGDAGAMLFDEEGIFFAPAYPLDNEVDPTGAGDTFAGAVLGFLARQSELNAKTLRQGLMIGATVASFCVEGVGTTELTRLTHRELAQRLADLRGILHVEA